MLYVVSGIIILFLLIPVYIIIPMSFSSANFMQFPPPGFSLGWYQNFFTDSSWLDALNTSLKVGISSTILALILGVLAAEGLVRTNFKGKRIIESLYRLPMIIPAIIIAIAVYRFETTIKISGSLLGIICAHTLLELPYVVSTILSRLSMLDPNYEYAASNLGANKMQTFIYVIQPIIRPAILSSAMFAFATSFDEAVVSLFVAGVDNNTLPRKIFESLQNEFDPSITAITSIVILVVTVILICGNSKDLFYRRNTK